MVRPIDSPRRFELVVQFLRGQEVVGGGEGVGDRGPLAGGADTGDRARFGVVGSALTRGSERSAVCPVAPSGVSCGSDAWMRASVTMGDVIVDEFVP